MIVPDFKYDAFISYSHSDKRAATRIQRYLESYRFPDGDKKLTVCLDDTDIRAGQLSAELEGMLANARTLIVCCSPSVAESEWVRREIETFQAQDESRSIVVLLIDGTAETSIPAPLRAVERQYPDLRRGWFLGWMRPRAQDAIVSAIATISDSDPRHIAQWDKRRQRRNLAQGFVTLSALAAIVLLFPFERTQRVNLPPDSTGIGVPEYCDVRDGALLLAARERTTDRNYVRLYPDVLGSNPDARRWMDDTPYTPPRRLLHVSAVDPSAMRRAREALDMAGLEQTARGIATGLENDYEDAFGKSIDLLRGGVWVAEPAPGLYVALSAINPEPVSPDDEGFDAPPSGRSVVAVASEGGATHIAVIDRLLPPDFSERPLTRRSSSFNDGLPVAVLDGDIWIGMPVRAEDGGLGGLWRSSDNGVSWEAVNKSGSVASLLAVAGDGRLLLATSPGRWDTGIREAAYETELHYFDMAAEQWSELIGPPYTSDSEVQFCGVTDDGTLMTRVDREVYSVGRSNLLSSLLRR